MPKKVRKFLDSTVGTWNITGTFEGTGSYRWDAGKGAVVGTGQWTNGEVSPSWTITWFWDGASKDGVMATWTAAYDGAVSQGRIRGKVLSPTVFEGKETAIILGKEFSDTLRIEQQDSNRRNSSVTNILHGGEPQPDMNMVFEKAGSEAAKPGPEHEKLGILVGDWSYTGQVPSQWEGTEFGPAGKFEGKTSLRLSLNGFFVEEHWQESFADGSRPGGTVLHGYDPVKDHYVTSSFDNKGGRMEGVVSINGSTMRSNSTFATKDGKTVLVKAVWHYTQDGNAFDANWKLSLDKGHSWQPWLKYKGKKISTAGR